MKRKVILGEGMLVYIEVKTDESWMRTGFFQGNI